MLRGLALEALKEDEQLLSKMRADEQRLAEVLKHASDKQNSGPNTPKGEKQEKLSLRDRASVPSIGSVSALLSSDDIPSPKQSFVLENAAEAVKEELAAGSSRIGIAASLPADESMKVSPLLRTASMSAIKPKVHAEDGKKTDDKTVVTKRTLLGKLGSSAADMTTEFKSNVSLSWTWTMVKEQLEKDPLTTEVMKKIRRGCILLQDGYQGRSSHGLYSLLDGPRWKRVLFRIQTADLWQHLIISASLLHAALFIVQPANHLAAWIDPTQDTLLVLLAEVLCILIYAADVVMKMLYFGGWSDYVSKTWQRNYLMLIAGMALDLVLYHLRLCPLRFSRPLRLCVLPCRHRDVRRLASFLPKMSRELMFRFTVPLFGAIIFFAMLCVRLWGRTDDQFGQDHFSGTVRAVRSLFMLSTLDNFSPVVTQAFHRNPLSFFFFLMFMVWTCFFLMSVALGVVFDLYVDDHAATVAAEAKKEKKSLDKAFAKLDLEGTGRIGFKHFAEMMRYMRPQDQTGAHAWKIFKTICHEQGTEELDRTGFGSIGEYLHVRFDKVKGPNPQSGHGHVKWSVWECRLVFLDALLYVFELDSLRVAHTPALFGGAIPELHIQLSHLTMSAMLSAVIYIWRADPFYMHHLLTQPWRQLDAALLVMSCVIRCLFALCPLSLATSSILPATAEPPAEACPWHFFCRDPWLPYLSTLEAAAAFRSILHHGPARLYLRSVMNILPVLMHVGGLVLTGTFFFATSTMELLPAPPRIRLDPAGFRVDRTCQAVLPSFDCPENAMVSIFQLFVGANWGDVVPDLEDSEGAWTGKSVWVGIVSAWIMIGYVFLGIGLYNLFTALLVEFHKVLMKEEHERLEAHQHARGKMQGIKAALRMKMMMGGLKEENKAKLSDEEAEVMVGRNKGNWRKRLQAPGSLAEMR